MSVTGAVRRRTAPRLSRPSQAGRTHQSWVSPGLPVWAQVPPATSNLRGKSPATLFTDLDQVRNLGRWLSFRGNAPLVARSRPGRTPVAEESCIWPHMSCAGQLCSVQTQDDDMARPTPSLPPPSPPYPSPRSTHPNIHIVQVIQTRAFTSTNMKCFRRRYPNMGKQTNLMLIWSDPGNDSPPEAATPPLAHLVPRSPPPAAPYRARE